MRNKFLLMIPALLLGSCAQSTPKPEEPETPEVPGGDEKPNEEVKVTKENLGLLYGEFFSEYGKLNVNENEFKVEGKKSLSLKLKSFETTDVNNFDTKVFYLGDNNEYRFYLSNDIKKELVLEKKNQDTSLYNVIDTFMPSIAEFTGNYRFIDGNNPSEYDNTYIFGNYFDYDRNYFTMNTFGLSSETLSLNGRYAKSYFKDYDGTYKKVVDVFYCDDNSLTESLYIELKDNQIKLFNAENKKPIMESAPSFLGSTYFDGKNSLYTIIDFAKQETKIGEVTYKYKENSSELGSSYLLTSGDSTKRYQSSPYGLKEITSEGESLYPFDVTNRLVGNFKGEGLTFTYYGETLMIDGKEAPIEYTIFDNQKAIKAKINEVVYHFVPYKDDYFTNIAIKAYRNDDYFYLINTNHFGEIFEGTYVSKFLDEAHTMEVSSDFKLKLDGVSFESNLYYVVKDNLPYITFTKDKTQLTFELHDEKLRSFVLKGDGETNYFFPKSKVDYLLDSFTSHHEKELIFNETNAIYEGETYSYSLLPYLDEFKGANFLSVVLSKDGITKQFLLDNNNNLSLVKGVSITGETEIEKTYIKHTDFLKLVGRYVYDGPFGEEDFVLKENGSFTADVLNANNTGLIQDKEFSYRLFYGYFNYNLTPILVFTYNKMDILFYYDQVAGVVATLRYIKEEIHNANGFYVNKDTNKSVYVNDGYLYVDGIKKMIDSYKLEGKVTTITSGSDTYVFTNNGDSKTVVVNAKEEQKLTTTNLDLSVFKGVTTTTQFATYLVKESEDLLGNKKYSLFVNDSEVDTNPIKTLYKGNLAIKFTHITDEVYAYIDEATKEVRLEVVSSIPLPPPPLPIQ